MAFSWERGEAGYTEICLSYCSQEHRELAGGEGAHTGVLFLTTGGQGRVLPLIGILAEI